MKRLFLIAFKQKKYQLRIIITVVAMLLLTLASQLEIFTLGVITKKAPNFLSFLHQLKMGILSEQM